jgi:hypothetical protein
MDTQAQIFSSRAVTSAMVMVAMLFAGYSVVGFAQDTDQADTTSASERECDFDVNVDCYILLSDNKDKEKTPKEAAPVDLSGYWMSVIAEDWRWRVLDPPKGDVASLPLNWEGMRVTNEWEENDQGTCKMFGAASLMRNPTRVRFEWDDDNTLRVETDHGEQTRLFHFDGATPGPEHPHSLQGYSVASWDHSGLKVMTTHLSAGYLRKNGVPYSSDATVTEYYDMYSAFEDTWMTVTTIVEDPKYLVRTYNTSLDFKQLADGSAWNPRPCVATTDS